jgi:hypothetical protein
MIPEKLSIYKTKFLYDNATMSPVADCYLEDDAAEIVRRYNCHKGLLEACKFGEMLEDAYFNCDDTNDREFQAMLGVFNLKAKQAIAAAEGEEC